MTRLLMLTHRVPFPPDRGDRVRSWNLLSFLARHAEVSLACVSDEPITAQQREALASVTMRCVIRRVGATRSRLRGLASLAVGGAATPAAFYRGDLRDTIVGWHDDTPFDTVLTFCTGMFHYARELQLHARAGSGAAGGGPRQVLDLVDVDSEKWAQLARQSAWPRRAIYRAEARRLRRIEGGVCGPVDAITVVSEREAELYRRVVRRDAPVSIAGNGVDLDYWRPLDDAGEPTLTFVGVLDYEPNVDGVRWFAREVWPRVRARVPNATVRVVGRHPRSSVIRLGAEPGVEIVGSVADVRPELARASGVIAPLRIARGVQNKVLEAMACGRAVVATPEAAAGVDAAPGRELLVGRDAAAFAEACVVVLTDPWRRRNVALAARQRVETRYRWEQTLAPMLDLVAPHVSRERAVRYAA